MTEAKEELAELIAYIGKHFDYKETPNQCNNQWLFHWKDADHVDKRVRGKVVGTICAKGTPREHRVWHSRHFGKSFMLNRLVWQYFYQRPLKDTEVIIHEDREGNPISRLDNNINYLSIKKRSVLQFELYEDGVLLDSKAYKEKYGVAPTKNFKITTKVCSCGKEFNSHNTRMVRCPPCQVIFNTANKTARRK